MEVSGIWGDARGHKEGSLGARRDTEGTRSTGEGGSLGSRGEDPIHWGRGAVITTGGSPDHWEGGGPWRSWAFWGTREVIKGDH